MNKYFLKELMETNCPSGYEKDAVKIFENFCNSLGAKHEFTDYMNNSCYSIGSGSIKVMISAHIDELGFQVQRITEEGLIQFVCLGGIDKKVLPGMVVQFLNKDLVGVIGKKPIHLEDRDDRDEVIRVKDLLVDIGSENKESAEKIVKVGDVFLPKNLGIINLGTNRFSAKGLDDKIGIFIITQVLDNLIQNKDNIKEILEKFTIYFVANTQEEVGLRGAMVTSKRINPDISIDLDVTFATDEGRDISLSEEGEVNLGKGPVIAYGPDKNQELNEYLEKIAENNNISVQRICSGAGGTNTAAIQEGSLNCMTTIISIPLRNMHTPVEVCDYRDIDNIIDLLTIAINNPKILK